MSAASKLQEKIPAARGAVRFLCDHWILEVLEAADPKNLREAKKRMTEEIHRLLAKLLPPSALPFEVKEVACLKKPAANAIF